MSYGTFLFHMGWKEQHTQNRKILPLSIIWYVSDAKNDSIYFVSGISIFKIYGLYLILTKQALFTALISNYELPMVAILVISIFR